MTAADDVADAVFVAVDGERVAHRQVRHWPRISANSCWLPNAIPRRAASWTADEPMPPRAVNVVNRLVPIDVVVPQFVERFGQAAFQGSRAADRKRGQSPFVRSTRRAVPAGTDRRLVGDCPLFLRPAARLLAVPRFVRSYRSMAWHWFLGRRLICLLAVREAASQANSRELNSSRRKIASPCGMQGEPATYTGGHYTSLQRQFQEEFLCHAVICELVHAARFSRSLG